MEGIKREAPLTDHTLRTTAHRRSSFLSLQPVDSPETEAKGGSAKPGAHERRGPKACVLT